MTDPKTPIAPTEINLHQKSRVLEIVFSDDTRFAFSCEYLRVFSPTDDVQAAQAPVHGKKAVNLSHIEPEGTASLLLQFDDDHTCNYTWSALHALAANYRQNWQTYLQQLDDHNLQRGTGAADEHDNITIRLLYFIQLAKVAGQDEEEVEVPATVTNVETLLAWMRKRGDDWNAAFTDDKVRVTVNKQFAELFTRLDQNDEVAFVPRPR